MNFFKAKPTPKEAAMEARKETKKTVRSNQREMDRTLRELDRQEKQTLAEIKRRAKVGNVGTNDPVLKNLAKQIIQIRASRDQTYQAKAQLGAVGMSSSMMASQVIVANSIEVVSNTMKTANEAMDVKQINKTMLEFSKETERMALKEEILDDMLADAFDADGEMMEEEADQVTGQVLAELGLELDGKMVDLVTPSAVPVAESSVPSAAVKEGEEDDILNQLPDLKSRLDAL